MGRRRNRFSFELVDPQLERRELLSRGGAPAIVATEGSPRAVGENLFHQNGINGLVLHKSFVNGLNDRLNTSKDRTTRLTQAFQVFEAGYKQLPVNPAAGAPGPTIDDLVSTLKRQVAIAEIRHESLNNQASPSQVKAIKFSPLAPIALVPFSDAQIDKMAATLSRLPPVAGPDGTTTNGDPTPAINDAVNAILNAEAETTVHPKLFLKTSDFYLNPNIRYDITFSGAPAEAAPGFFIRGPGGTILPGATLHPHAPN
jgi:hypothetical protein